MTISPNWPGRISRVMMSISPAAGARLSRARPAPPEQAPPEQAPPEQAPPEQAPPEQAERPAQEPQSDQGRPEHALPPLALWPVLAIAAAATALIVAYSGRYGYHGDELYFLAAGRHLAWGYPDQPPLVPLIARLMSDLAPGSLVVLRLPAALATGPLVVLTALLTREFRGGRAAQLLACAVLVLAPIIGSMHGLGTEGFDLLVSVLLVWLVVRILRTGDRRGWLLVGLTAGAGLLDSDLVVFLMFAIVAGLAIAGPRWPLRSGWLLAGGVIALAMWAPYLAWQASHSWPEFAVARSIADGRSGSSASWWQILPGQLDEVPFWLAPIWIAGLARLLRDRELRPYRAIGIAFGVLAVLFMATGGKPYYLAVLLPVLVAAGAQPTVAWAGRAQPRLRRGLLAAGLVLGIGTLPATLPILPVSVLRHTTLASSYDIGATIGWPAYVHEIAQVYHSLPPAQRASAAVVTSNYGEAGAVERFGAAEGLPAVAYSPETGFWYWGAPSAAKTVAIIVGADRSQVGMCGSARVAATLDNHAGLASAEQGKLVWICTELRQSWPAIWSEARYLG